MKKHLPDYSKVRHVPPYREGSDLDEAVALAAQQKFYEGPVTIRFSNGEAATSTRPRPTPFDKAAAAAEARQVEQWYRAGCKSTYDGKRVKEA